MPRSRLLYQLGTGILGIVLALASRDIPAMREFLLFGGCTLAGVSFLSLSQNHRAYRRYYARFVQQRPAYTEQRELTFDERGMKFTTAYSVTELFWTAYQRLTEDERFFYLHSAHFGSKTVLPKRIFTDADSLQDFLRCSQPIPRA